MTAHMAVDHFSSERRMAEKVTQQVWALALHGGAGVISLNDAQAPAYKQGLLNALSIGKAILQQGGKAIDAAVCI